MGMAQAFIRPGCNQILHFDIPQTEYDFIVLTNQLQISEPVVIVSGRWPLERLKLFWSRSYRTTCVQHTVITRYERAMDHFIYILQHFFFERFERQFHLYVILTRSSNNIENFELTEFNRKLDSRKNYVRSINSWNFIFTPEDIKVGIVVRRVLYAKLYCSASVLSCLIEADSADYDSILNGIWLKEKTAVDLQGWPLEVYPSMHEIYPKMAWNYDYISKMALRNVFVPSKPVLYALPLAHICTNLARKLNASATSDTESGVLAPMLLPISSQRGDTASAARLHTGHSHEKFIYCWNQTNPYATNVLAFLTPFDLYSWVLFGLASSFMVVILLKSKGQHPWFSVFASLMVQYELPSAKRFHGILLWWIVAGWFLNNLYAGFIQSVVVVPSTKEMIDNFQQLDAAQYRIVINVPPDYKVVDDGGEYFGGTDYLERLRANFEYVPFDNRRSELSYIISHPKKCLLLIANSIGSFKTAAASIFPDVECHIGTDEMEGHPVAWLAIAPYPTPVRDVLYHQFTSGILQHMTADSWHLRRLWLHRLFIEPDFSKWNVTEWDQDTNEDELIVGLENAQFQLVLAAWMGLLMVAGGVFLVQVLVKNKELLVRLFAAYFSR